MPCAAFELSLCCLDLTDKMQACSTGMLACLLLVCLIAYNAVWFVPLQVTTTMLSSTTHSLHPAHSALRAPPQIVQGLTAQATATVSQQQLFCLQDYKTCFACTRVLRLTSIIEDIF